jgi:hypothetical protein
MQSATSDQQRGFTGVQKGERRTEEFGPPPATCQEFEMLDYICFTYL